MLALVAATINLASNPSTGYSWSITTDPDPNVAIATSADAVPSSTGLPGAPGEQCFAFHAEAPGVTTIAFSYARPFDPTDTPPAERQTVRVVVGRSGPAPMQIPAPE